MNKLVVICFVCSLILMVGTLAMPDVKEDIKELVKEKKGVDIQDEEIEEINFTDLPSELDIDKVSDTNIAIYKVNYTADKPLFVISSGEPTAAVEGPVISEARSLLSFGYAGEKSESGFLKMESGVEGSLKKGYVMMRPGSITGLSTNLEVTDAGVGDIEIIIYKNGNEVGFRNILSAGSLGVKMDYDVLTKDIVNFKAGDTISVYVKLRSGAVLSDVTTVLEITN